MEDINSQSRAQRLNQIGTFMSLISSMIYPEVGTRGGVLEDVLGLEDVLEDTF